MNLIMKKTWRLICFTTVSLWKPLINKIKLICHPDSRLGRLVSDWRSHVCNDRSVDPPHFFYRHIDRLEHHKDRRHEIRPSHSHKLKYRKQLLHHHDILTSDYIIMVKHRKTSDMYLTMNLFWPYYDCRYSLNGMTQPKKVVRNKKNPAADIRTAVVTDIKKSHLPCKILNMHTI